MRALQFAFCILCLHWSAAFADTTPSVAGTASIVAGTVSAQSLTGAARVLHAGDAVYAGDRIRTGAAAYVRIGLLDGGSMVLRPHTEFAIEAFRFRPDSVESALQVVPSSTVPSSAASVDKATNLAVVSQAEVGNQAVFRLLRGGFRAISGLIGKINREEYAVRTPVATIGIRGTVFWSVTCEASCAADAVVQGVLPEGVSALGGTVSAVDQGAIELSSLAGNTLILEAPQYVFTTASGAQYLLPRLPGFLAGEDWLSAAQMTTSNQPSSTQMLINTNLSTLPTSGTLAATTLIGVIALTTDAEGGGDPTGPGTNPPTNTTTSTSR